MFQRDYILRIIQQTVQGIARAVGLMRQQKLDEADHEIGAAYSALAFDRELIGVLSAATLARQLGDDERIAAAVRVLICDARLARWRGNTKRVNSLLGCAEGLLLQLATPDAALAQELDLAIDGA